MIAIFNALVVALCSNIELTLTTGQINLLLIFRANMPDKASEEKANLAKKLAEQRAKGVEGIPTTAKVRYPRTIINHVKKKKKVLRFSFQLFHFQICSSKSTSLSLMSMRSKTLSLQQTFLVNPNFSVP